jgi:hypothetical protein
MTRRRKLVAGVAAVIVLAGVATGVALARSQPAYAAPRLVLGKPLMTAAAAYLGVSLKTLKGEVTHSRPLTAIARSTPGRTVAGLQAAIVHDAKWRLDQGHMGVGGIQRRYVTKWLNRHIAPWIAGQCPLKLSQLFIRLGGTCQGMMTNKVIDS